MEAPLKAKTAEEIRSDWRSLWLERFDDEVRAEGVSSRDYSALFVEKGLVILATRDFKMLDLKEILCRHGFGDVDRLLPVDPAVGGWGKFIRSSLPRNRKNERIDARARIRRELPRDNKKQQQRKKGGRGWLHV